MRLTLLVFLGVATAACSELPAITAAPTDGGTAEPSPDAGPSQDAGLSPDAGPSQDAGLTVEANPCETMSSGVLADGSPVACDGEWALVLKVAQNSSQFAYNGPCWGSSAPCAAETRGADTSAEEGRFPAFSRIRGTELRVILTAGNNQYVRTFPFTDADTPKTLAKALSGATFERTVDAASATYLDRAKLNSSAVEGINVGAAGGAQVRLGIVGSVANAPVGSSWLGVGGRIAPACFATPDTFPTVGNVYVGACANAAPPPTPVSASARVYIK